MEYFSATVSVTPEGGDRFEEVPAMNVIPAVVPSYQNLDKKKRIKLSATWSNDQSPFEKKCFETYLWIRSLVSVSRMTSPFTPCPLLESSPAK